MDDLKNLLSRIFVVLLMFFVAAIIAANLFMFLAYGMSMLL